MTKKRVKKAPKPKGNHPRQGGPSENEIHMKAWAWVQKTHPTLLIFHVANERKAAPQYHVKLKRLGVLKGVADFLAFPADGRKFAIELKDSKGTQDAEQVKFQRRWEHAGGLYFVARTVEDFQFIISMVQLDTPRKTPVGAACQRTPCKFPDCMCDIN